MNQQMFVKEQMINGIHIPFEFVAASAIFWNASKYDEIAWIAALQKTRRRR